MASTLFELYRRIFACDYTGRDTLLLLDHFLNAEIL
jgi:hypothetical protein